MLILCSISVCTPFVAQGECVGDGLYYMDEHSFIMCNSKNFYIQPCSPGTMNRPYDGYASGDKYDFENFCDINLVDIGYNSPAGDADDDVDQPSRVDVIGDDGADKMTDAEFEHYERNRHGFDASSNSHNEREESRYNEPDISQKQFGRDSRERNDNDGRTEPDHDMRYQTRFEGPRRIGGVEYFHDRHHSSQRPPLYNRNPPTPPRRGIPIQLGHDADQRRPVTVPGHRFGRHHPRHTRPEYPPPRYDQQPGRDDRHKGGSKSPEYDVTVTRVPHSDRHASTEYDVTGRVHKSAEGRYDKRVDNRRFGHHHPNDVIRPPWERRTQFDRRPPFEVDTVYRPNSAAEDDPHRARHPDHNLRGPAEGYDRPDEPVFRGYQGNHAHQAGTPPPDSSRRHGFRPISNDDTDSFGSIRHYRPPIQNRLHDSPPIRPDQYKTGDKSDQHEREHPKHFPDLPEDERVADDEYIYMVVSMPKKMMLGKENFDPSPADMKEDVKIIGYHDNEGQFRAFRESM